MIYEGDENSQELSFVMSLVGKVCVCVRWCVTLKKLVVITENSGADLFVDYIDARQAAGEAEHGTTITESTNSECTLALQLTCGPSTMPAIGEFTFKRVCVCKESTCRSTWNPHTSSWGAGLSTSWCRDTSAHCSLHPQGDSVIKPAIAHSNMHWS